MEHFDVIVVGSGFGGAVMAARLAEKGAKVLVLERGRRWEVSKYPRQPEDPWIFDHDKPQHRNGWIDLRFFPDMAVVQGAGVGGGSLIYANVSIEAKPEVFEHGWPEAISYAELKPHYDTVAKMLNVQQIPDNQVTRRYQLMQEGAEKLGHGERFRKVDLAVTFDEAYHHDLPDRFDPRHSKTWTNAQGQSQGTCIHLGNCDIGCDMKAKNTLDLNYLPLAEQHGADIRPLHMVRYLKPEGSKYRAVFDRIEDGGLKRGSCTCDRLVLAAGSLGSTEILLRCRDQYKTLHRLSHFLGKNWSSNGDFLTPAFHEGRDVSPTQGPTITSAIDFLDGTVNQSKFFIEDGGFPNVFRNLFLGHGSKKYKLIFGELGRRLKDRDVLDCVMPWFAQGIDAGDGRFYLGRKWYWPWHRVLKLDWSIERSESCIDAIVAMHKSLAEATGGEPWVPPTYSLLKDLITPHPLGGCNMGDHPQTAVVDHACEVFGHERLYVVDSAVIPRPIGLNPSRTIAAVAERAASLISF